MLELNAYVLHLAYTRTAHGAPPQGQIKLKLLHGSQGGGQSVTDTRAPDGCALVIRQYAYVSKRQHTSAYVSMQSVSHAMQLPVHSSMRTHIW